MKTTFSVRPDSLETMAPYNDYLIIYLHNVGTYQMVQFDNKCFNFIGVSSIDI